MHRLFLKCYPKLWGMELVGMEKLKEPRGFLFIALCGKKKKKCHMKVLTFLIKVLINSKHIGEL